jgi:hypothetical protein
MSVDHPVHAKSPPKGVPPNGFAKALDARMQPRTSPRKTGGIIHHDFLIPGDNPQ